MGFQFCDPNTPRGWVNQLNESLAFLKAKVENLDTTRTSEREAVKAEVDRAAALVKQAEVAVLSLSERVARLEVKLANLESR